MEYERLHWLVLISSNTPNLIYFNPIPHVRAAVAAVVLTTTAIVSDFVNPPQNTRRRRETERKRELFSEASLPTSNLPPPFPDGVTDASPRVLGPRGGELCSSNSRYVGLPADGVRNSVSLIAHSPILMPISSIGCHPEAWNVAGGVPQLREDRDKVDEGRPGDSWVRPMLPQ